MGFLNNSFQSLTNPSSSFAIQIYSFSFWIIQHNLKIFSVTKLIHAECLQLGAFKSVVKNTLSIVLEKSEILCGKTVGNIS